MIFESSSEKDTYAFAKTLAGEAQPGEVYCLNGDLGVGKTVFSKGFAAGLGLCEPVSSPTFTILQVYEDGRIPLYHMDVYRIEDEEELYEIGFDEFIYGDGVCLIEWAERVTGMLPEHFTEVSIYKNLEKGFDYRSIRVEKR